MLSKIRNKKGFSLVELLVVLAIVGILMALAVGGIRIVQEVNRDTQRKSLVRDIQLAIESYQEKENGYPESVTLDDDDPSGECEGTLINAGGEEVCSKVSFDTSSWNSDSCDGYKGGQRGEEDEAGEITGCYEDQTKAYYMYVELERTDQRYNAGNVGGT